MGQIVSLLSANIPQVDAIENHHQCRIVDFNGIACYVRRKFKSTFSELFVPEHKAIAFPNQDFEPVASAIAKDEKASGQRISTHERANLSRQAAEAHSHIGGFAAKVDFQIAEWNEHRFTSEPVAGRREGSCENQPEAL